MMKQCSMVSRSIYFHLRRIAKIRCHLDYTATAKAIQATVISRLDYCNSLLSTVNKANLETLQRAQNSAARLLARVDKRTHMTPVLFNLHWLPVKQRVEFKILVQVYTLVHETAAPQYL